MENKSVFERLLWFCVYVSLISCTIFLVVTLWSGFSIHPTVTTLVSSTYPVDKIPFPGVSICSINKISKKRARSLAFRIANITRRDPEEIMTFIRYIGQLYDFDFEPESIEKLLEFQSILDMLKMRVIDVARNIANPCGELLRICAWRNVEVSCRKVFSMRLTHSGYCCVFNYVKITEELSSETFKKPITTDAGIENGLYVSVSSQPSDNYYSVISSSGVMVHIFVATDYPDKTSGGVTEILTSPDSENYIEIVPTTLTAVPEVADYPVEKRLCLFDRERPTTFRGIYSQSDCNVDCRIKSIQAMCECIPFMIPFSDDNSVCTLADIPCLSKYKYKWSSFFPGDDVWPHLQKEKQDSLRCNQQCYSACGETVYKASVTSFPILNNTDKEENITRVYVYYLKRFSNLYRQDVVYYWFEVLSNFGGIFGIFLGWSLIFMVQFLIYYSRKVAEKLIL